MSYVKKVLAVHDLSGLGRCSLSVVLPILSAMGVQAVPLPTAVLSTQTDGFEGFHFRDLTCDIIPYFEHLSSVTSFDAFYSGFLGSAEQIEKMLNVTSTLQGKTPILIDPVMGDNGTLYSTFDEDFCREMRRYVKTANLVVPNVTEASFLLEKEPKESYTKDEIKTLLSGVAKLCQGKAVITGIKSDDTIGCVFTEDGGITIGEVNNPSLEKHYPGTGDIFASVMLGALMKGKGLPEAVLAASSFVYNVMKHSMNFDYPSREGVLLEDKLPLLMNFS